MRIRLKGKVSIIGTLVGLRVINCIFGISERDVIRRLGLELRQVGYSHMHHVKSCKHLRAKGRYYSSFLTGYSNMVIYQILYNCYYHEDYDIIEVIKRWCYDR